MTSCFLFLVGFFETRARYLVDQLDQFCPRAGRLLRRRGIALTVLGEILQLGIYTWFKLVFHRLSGPDLRRCFTFAQRRYVEKYIRPKVGPNEPESFVWEKLNNGAITHETVSTFFAAPCRSLCGKELSPWSVIGCDNALLRGAESPSSQVAQFSGGPVLGWPSSWVCEFGRSYSVAVCRLGARAINSSMICAIRSLETLGLTK